jgi:periplasmic protein TonB
VKTTHEPEATIYRSTSVLNGCLVDGDPEQLARERKTKRRALVMSITLQGLVLGVIVLVPLLGRPAPLPISNVTPVPPYYSPQRPHVTPVQPVHTPPRTHPIDSTLYQPRAISKTIVTHDPPSPQPPDEGPISSGIPMQGTIPLAQASRQPEIPREPKPETPKVVHLSHIESSKLSYRVEPVYPVLARQIGRGGHVELRAVISEDGMIESLEAVGGDPMFFASAMQAVRQWRYTPTLLNGQAVKVDTFITVIYNVAR